MKHADFISFYTKVQSSVMRRVQRKIFSDLKMDFFDPNNAGILGDFAK